MRGIIYNIVPAVVLMLLALGQTTAHAAAECKGLSKSSCTANSGCSWISSYKTKTGKQVNAYCRLKPGKKASADKSSGKDKTGKKADKALTESKTKMSKTGNDNKKPVTGKAMEKPKKDSKKDKKSQKDKKKKAKSKDKKTKQDKKSKKSSS